MTTGEFLDFLAAREPTRGLAVELWGVIQLRTITAAGDAPGHTTGPAQATVSGAPGRQPLPASDELTSRRRRREMAGTAR